MAAIDMILPLLSEPRSVADLCQLTRYKPTTIGVALAELKRWGKVEISKVNRGAGNGSGAPIAIYRLKA